MGLFFILEGEEDVLGVDDVSNVIHRDECFFSSIDLNASTCNGSPAKNYLDKDSYLTEDGIMKYFLPYSFSTKVQTHESDTPTYKDILRLPEEERKLLEAFMVKRT